MAANSKNVLTPFPLLTAQSLSASFVSAPTVIQYLDNVSIQINATTSDAIGEFTIEGSLDHVRVAPANYEVANGNWVTIPLGTSATLAGASTSILIDMNQLSFPWIRVRYTRTSGTGTASVFISAKAV